MFYFDLVPPYGYLGSIEVERLAARLGRAVEWRPVLLGFAVMRVMRSTSRRPSSHSPDLAVASIVAGEIHSQQERR